MDYARFMLAMRRVAWVHLLATLSVTALGAAAEDAKTSQAFFEDCALKSAAAQKTGHMALAGRDGWLFFGPELRHLSVGKFWGESAAGTSKAAKPEFADPLPAILDFKAQLDKAGVELLLVPVPPKAIIYPEFVSEKVTADKDRPLRLDVHHQAFYRLLRDHGVNVIDLVPEFLEHRLDKEGTVYCRQDTHWSGQACILAARRIARELHDQPWLAKISKADLSHELRSIEITGDLWRDLGDKAPAKEKIPLRFVGVKQGSRLEPVEPDKSSPVVLLGDSHNLIFHAGEDMQAKGAGLADQLALELGFAVDVVAVRGSGATPARVNLLRRTQGKADYLSGKKLVIWCFSAREFTESDGWKKVPIVK